MHPLHGGLDAPDDLLDETAQETPTVEEDLVFPLMLRLFNHYDLVYSQDGLVWAEMILQVSRNSDGHQ